MKRLLLAAFVAAALAGTLLLSPAGIPDAPAPSPVPHGQAATP